MNNQDIFLDPIRFKIICKISTGALDVVYKIEDLETNQYYAANVSNIEYESEESSKYSCLFREINTMMFLKHPSIIKFVGYSHLNYNGDSMPAIITEFVSNGSLRNIIKMEMQGTSPESWTFTKKLINIYGIASGMSYLHAHNILHRDLKPDVILLDDYLHPRISGFCLTEKTILMTASIKIQSSRGSVGTPFYMAPEILMDESYSNASDVYSFALLVYEIMSSKEISTDLTLFKFITKVTSENYRPELTEEIPDSYRNLIKKCWSKNPKDRPSFDQIVEELKINRGFITDLVDESEFFDYVRFIETNNQLLDKKNATIDFKDFILEERNKKVEKEILNAPEKKRKRKDSVKKPNKQSNQESLQIENTFDINQYEIQKKIGEGSFGEVFKVKDKITGEIYAAKVTKKKKFQGEEEDDDDEEILDIDLKREVNNSSKFNHPAIVKFIGFSFVDFTGSKRPVMVIEFMKGGSLNDYITKARKGMADPRWTDTKKLIIIYGIAAAMDYLHKYNVIHRDLKPANILMDEDLNPKIADFGLSKTLHSNQESVSTCSKAGFKGTLLYSPPEVINNEKPTKSCDIYAFAIITYEIMTIDIPFGNCTPIKLMSLLAKEMRPEFKSPIHEAYKELIESCWDQEPQNRPTFSEIVDKLKNESRFITDMVDEGEFLNYVDYIDEYPISFKKNKIIPSFREFCKEKKLQKVVETDDSIQTKSTSVAKTKIKESSPQQEEVKVEKHEQAITKECIDDTLDEIRNKEADELFQIWEKLFYGKGIPSDPKSSLKYIKLAAEKGHITSMFSYASMLNSGIGTRIDKKKASIYFKKAADEGHIESMHIYASMMSKGDGLMINKDEALDYFKKAADKGHVDSMYKYAMMLYKYFNSSKDDVKIYFKKAADNGHINAMYSYANILNKEKKKENFDEMKIYYKTAAENGHINAMFDYAEILNNEKGNKALKKEAANYYKMAADRGKKEAMLIYADILKKGIGVPVNKKESEIYLQMAKTNK